MKHSLLFLFLGFPQNEIQSLSQEQIKAELLCLKWGGWQELALLAYTPESPAAEHGKPWNTVCKPLCQL